MQGYSAFRHFSEEERKERVAGLLQGVQAVRAAVKEEVSPGVLSDGALKVFVKAALEPGTQLLELYESQGLHAAQGKSAVEELVARGFVKVHRLVRKGSGALPQVLEVLQLGVDELAKRGIPCAEKRLKRGGFRHDVYARWLERWAKVQGVHYSFERVLGRKAFDFVSEDAQGVLRAIEICLSGSVRWNAEQAIKGAEVQGVAEVVVACERKEFVMAILSEVKEIDALGLYRKKIVGKVLAEYSA